MPIINTAHCKLVGLCCLTGEERKRVYREWNERFHEHESFWLDVKAGQSAIDITRNVAQLIREQGIVHMAGTMVVIAAFLDLTAAPDAAMLKEICDVADRLHGALGCNVEVTAQFGHLGELAFADKQALRDYAAQAVAVNHGNPNALRPLYLVGSSPLVLPEDDNCWKAVMVFLDVLRRETAPATMIRGGNPDGDIGFLRYGEYDQKKLGWLTSEHTRLTKGLSDEGEGALDTLLKEVYSGFVTEIREKYQPDGNAQPLHPDMIVTGAIRRWQAEHGHLASFEAAKNSTWAALALPGKRLQEIILESYGEMIGNADIYLAKYLEKAGVGVALEKNAPRMELRLTPQKIHTPAPQPPVLNYRSSGRWTQEINDYLNSVVEYAAAKVKFTYGEALLAAYKKVPAESYAAREKDMRLQLSRVETRLKGVMDRQQFISLATTTTPLPLACFFPVLGGGSQSNWVLTREQDDFQMLTGMCSGTQNVVYYIDERTGGLKLVDNAPVKKLQAMIFNCDQNRLQDLI